MVMASKTFFISTSTTSDCFQKGCRDLFTKTEVWQGSTIFLCEALDYDNPDPTQELQNVSSSADTTVPSQQELDLLFGPLYDEFFNDGTSRVNKSSSPTDNSALQDTQPSTNIHPTTIPSTLTHVNSEENKNDQA
ncbi:hypothetical protein Tco_0719197 [Tanacetum coccineum]